MVYRVLVGAALCLLSVVPFAAQAQTVAFLDDQGAPAATLVDGSAVRVRVVDSAANTGPGRDVVSATVTSDLAGDSESLPLLETGPGTGVFEGLIDLEPGGSPSAPTLATATSAGPPAQRDTIHASYGSTTAAAGLVGSIVRFIDDWRRESTSFAAGHGVGLRARDELRNNPLSRDSLTVTVTSQSGGDSESVSLEETGMNTGVFEGDFATTHTTGTGLHVGVPDTMTAVLVAFDSLTAAVVQAQIAGAVVVLRDEDGNMTDTFLESSLIRIRAIDAALPGVVHVQVTSALTGDSETITLMGGWIYEGEIQTELLVGPAQPNPGDGVLQIAEVVGPPAQWDTVTVTYSVSGGPVSASAGFIPGRLAFLDSQGEVTSTYAADGEARIRLEAPRFDTMFLDQTTVRLVNTTTGEEEYVQLRETRHDSGVFIGSIPLAVNGSGQWHDNVLNAQPGEQIEVASTTGDIAPQTAEVTDLSLEFLDEWGEPTDEIVESGPARVRMFNTSANVSSASADSVSVEMRVLSNGDLETLTLTETGPDTNVFEGTIPLEMGTYGNPDGKLQTANTGMPDYRPDAVTARSGPVEATARTVGARILFLDAFGRRTTSYAAGETVRLRIVDHFRPLYGSSFQVTLASLLTTDFETVTMQQTAPGSAVFEGSIPTAVNGILEPNDGKLLVGIGLTSLIEVRHATGFSPIELTEQASITESSVRFVDAAGQPATVYLESTRAYVQLVSGYANNYSGVPETFSIEIRAELSQDGEMVALTETGPNTSVFMGSIPLQLLTSGSPSLGNGVLETTETGSTGYHSFDVLRATPLSYSLPGDPSVARIDLTGSRTWLGNAAGDEVLSYPVGGTAYVWVEDHTRDTPGQFDQAQADVQSFSSPSAATAVETETVTLQETTANSGIFRAAVQLKSTDTSYGDGQILVLPGGQIEARHQDTFGATWSTAVANITDASIEFVDDAGQPTAELLEGGTARVRMFSLSANTSWHTADTVSVQILTLRSGDEESLMLTETGPDTSVFEGSLPMARGPGSFNDGVIETANSGSPDYLQDEVTARYSPAVTATARVVGARMVFLDRYGRETESIVAGEPVRVRVVDYNRNDAGTQESFDIYLSVLQNGDTVDHESLSLQETGFDTSVFEGSLPTTFGGSGGPSNGQLRLLPGDRIQAIHFMSAQPHGLEVYADVTGSSVLFIDAAGQPATVYLESSRARVRVVSTYANMPPFGSPSNVDTVSVEVRSELSPDIETVSLTETGPNTGVFEGGIQMRLSNSGVYQNSGILETVEMGPPHQFDTVRATFSDATGTSVAQIGLTGSRTWFADASGTEVLAYPVGGTAYVRVEDQSFNTPGMWDQVQALVSSLSTGDQESLTLQETSRDSGIFVRAVELTPDAAASDGKLSVAPGGQIMASHTDYLLNTSSSAVADIADAAVEFLNDAGEPAAELLESGTARVRLFNLTSNTSPYTADTANLQIRTLRSQDEEMVTLTETGPDTNVFEGSLPMAQGPRSLANGVIETVTSGDPEYRQDEVTASWSPDVSATALVVGARMVFLDRYGRETESLVAGEPVRVRVVNYTRNDAGTQDNVNIYLSSRDGADAEPLTLQETGFDTATFEGSLPSTFGGSGGSYDGQLRVLPGDRVQAIHYLESQPHGLEAYADVTGSSVLFIDAAGQPAAVYLESSRARVRVVSPYANSSPSSADSVSIEVRSELSPDIETVALTETGPSTGVFEGGIQMRLSNSGVYQGSGILETVEMWPPHEFDTLRATFSDATGTSMAHIGLTGSRTWFADASGAEVLSYPVGGTAYVRVEDQSFNTPGMWDQIQVLVSSLSTGDQEPLTLQETSRDSGIFVRAVELTPDATASDGKLSVAPGGQIMASHTDYLLNTSSSAVADIANAAVEFLNEAGEPTAELLESGTARVRLFNLSSNTSPSTADTAQLQIRTLRSQDEEMVTLTETGPDTNVFEGSLPMAQGPRSLANGVIETTTSGDPEYRQDEVTASWSPDVSATALVVGARMVFLDRYGRETESLVAGEPVRVRVVNYTENDAVAQDTVNVYLSSRDGADNEPLTLQETGFDTAIFEGSLPSTFGGSGGSYDGQLRVLPGDRVQATHYLASQPHGLEVYADVTGSSALFIDAAGQPATVYLESSRARVRVVSTYANMPPFGSPSNVDTMSVEVRSELSPDIETISLTETGPDTGVFEGGIQMRLSNSGVYQGNGILETVEMWPPHEFDTLRATFSDATGTSVARIGLTGSRTWFADASGAEVQSYPVGGTAYVRVEDQNFNTPGMWDQIQVLVSSLSTGDQEPLTLQETSRDSGIFVRAVELTPATAASDGKLSVAPGGQIMASHSDYLLNTSSSAVADIAFAAVEFLNEAGEPTAELLESGTARVRLFNLTANTSPYTVDTVNLQIRTLRSEDEEMVTLTETGPDTNVFEGSLPMARGPRSLANGVTETVTSGYPEYWQDEVTASWSPDVSATALVVGARMAFLDRYGRETESLVAGEPVRVRVVDYTRNDAVNRDTVNAYLSSRDGADNEPLTLQETGFDTAIFEGSLPSTFGGGGGSYDGQLRVLPGDRVQAIHYLESQPHGLEVYADVTGSSALFIDAAGQPAAVYLESSRARVRVVSTAGNGNPSSADTVSVEVRSELSPDIETISLTETGPNTGVFEGGIQMRLSNSGAYQGNGLLETVEMWPPHEFDTLRATFSDATGTSVAHIGLTGSRTWFADASGAEVQSYPVGGTAYVRVEDQSFNTPGMWDQIQVLVSSLSTGDQEPLTLQETSRDSGIFVRAVELTPATAASDGKLSVAPGGQIMASHSDYLLNTSSSAVADIAFAAVEFLNEAGEPTAELLESGTARVRLFNLSSNTSPSTADTAQLQIRTLRSQDEEMVTLTETGPDTNVFEGSLPMAQGPRSLANGVIETVTSGNPEYRQDEVTASWSPDVSATALVVGARMAFLDRYGRETESLVAGEPVRVRVVDYTRNDAVNRDTVSIYLSSRDGADNEPLTLQETGFDTAIFEGSLPSTFGGGGGSYDGQLRVLPGDRVQATHYLESQPHGLEVYADVTGSSALFIDAAGQPAAVYLESSRARVRVVSTAGNGNPSSADTVSLEVRSELSPDIETISLTETGPNTGVFEGGIQMRLSNSGAHQNNGLLETVEMWPPHEFDTLRATFSDAAGTSVAHIGLTGSRTWFADASGAEVLSYPMGGTAYVRVEDQNFNTPGMWDQIQVLASSLSTGDQEPLTLQETSRDSGIFVRAVELTTATAASDGKLSVAPGGQIMASHSDYLLNTSSSAVADIAFAAVEFLNEAGEPTAELLESGTARVRLFNLSSNTSPSTADTAYLQIRTLRSQDEEMVTLTETGANTNVFEGSLPMARGPRSLANGVIETVTSGNPEYWQDEVTASWSPDVSATALVVGARMAFLDRYGRETESLVAGEPVRVRVVDYTRNDAVNRDTADIYLSSRDGADSEPLTLQETGFDTAIFEGSLPSTFGGGGGSYDGQLRILPGDRVQATHYLESQPNGLEVYAGVTGSSVLFIDAAGQPAAVYLESSQARVRVVSTAGNGNPSSADTVSVEVRSELSPDVETVVLTETGPSTGVFEGGIQMRLSNSGAFQGNGILETVEMWPPHEFDTLRATFSDAAGTSVAHIGLTGSRTWFADASGAEVLSYPVGGTAYVRVEDQNFNTPGLPDQISVLVHSMSTGDQEPWTLQETAPDSGIFVRAIELTPDAAASDGKLSVSPGDQIEASHTDYLLNTSSSAVASINHAAVEFLNDAGQPTVELLEGGDARVRLFSLGSNTSPGTADTAWVQLRTLRSEDEETVTLTETGANTNVFEGSLPMARGPRSLSNGVVETVNSGAPEYLMDEVTAHYGASVSATATLVPARVVFLNLRGQEVSTYALLSTIRVRVIDHALNANPGQGETLDVSIRSLVSNESETFTLTETGPDTGVFEGSIPTTGSGTSIPDGSLVAPPGQVEVSHSPSSVPETILRQATILATPGPQAADDTATTVEDEAVVIPVLANDTGNSALAVAEVTQPSHGSVVINPDATITYTPAAGYTGPDAFTYLVIDAQGGEDVGNVAVTVTPDNQAPAPNPDFATTPEDQPLTVNVLANDTDPDQDPLDVVAVTQPAAGGGAAVLNADDTITYTPPPNAITVAYMTYTVRDPDGAEASTMLRVEVTAVNDPPVANDDTASTDEDTAVGIDVRANDSDIDSATYAPSSVTAPAHGTAEIVSGNILYTPGPGFSGTDSFSYTLQDDAGATDTATVMVTVNGVNDAPVANDDTATVAEDGSASIAVLGNDTDPDNDTLQVVSVTQGDHGTVAINPNGTVTYTPAANFHGTDTFTYTAGDGNGGTDTATVTVTVTPVNDAPAANADTATVTEDGSVAVPVLANDDDAEDDTLTVTAVTQGAHGAVAINPDDTVTYTPAANYNGTDSFTYTVSDGNGGTATATVTVTIESDNDAPVAGADSATTAEDTAVDVNVLANDSDPDNDTLTVASVTQGEHGTVSINPDKTVRYTPAANYHGADTFTCTVSDGNGGSATATVTITVTSVNDNPVANADTALAAEDGTVAVPVLANDDDADNDTLTVTAVTQGAHGAVSINANQTVTYTPAANYNGADSFTYTVSDGNGGTATATVSVTVGSDNDAPVAGADSATTAEDTAVTVTVLANDSDLDNDALDVISVTQGTNGTVTLNADDTVTYTPALNFHGTDTFTYTVSDGNGGSATATVTITVTPVNDNPAANADTALAAEDGTVAVPVLANDDDVDNDTLTVTSVTQGAHGAVVINANQTVSYTPAANYNGSDSFTYTVSDGNGGTATATVSVTVGSDNDAPVAGDDSATTAEDTAATVTVLGNDSDLENDALDVVSVTQGTNGTVALNANDTVTYTPALNFHGTDTFTYTVSDGNGGSDTATVTVTVTPVNDAPAANADTALVAEDGSVAVPVLANDADADNDTLTVTSATQGAHGAVVINANQTVTYTPAANYSGGDSFTYTVSDGNGGTATATVTVTVDSVNDAPTANADAASVAEDGSVAVTVLANDSDPENNTLSVTSVTQGAHGSVTINANNTVTYVPAANYSGGDAFTYTMSDGNGGTATAAVTVTVTPVNDAPVAVNDTATTVAETLVDIAVLSNDADIDGPSLSVQSATPPAHGTVSVNANQTIRYTPASGYKGADSFTYTVTDGAGGTATATVNITVNAPPRVATNLQVLYGFNEGSGTTVNDISGVGTPLNLTIGSASAVSWISGGLQVNSATLIQSAGAATKVITAGQSTNAITIEAWINPANTTQTGPAPVVTVSQQSNKQNFSLGQLGNRWDGHLRTSSTNNAGTGLTSATGTATLNLTHVLYTRDASGNVRIYINGVQSASSTLTGNFSTWTSNYKLGLVNELATGSPWLGKLYLVAIYNRALSSTEARQNWLAGE